MASPLGALFGSAVAGLSPNSEVVSQPRTFGQVCPSARASQSLSEQAFMATTAKLTDEGVVV